MTKTIDAAGLDWNGKTVASGPNPQTGPFFVEGAEPGDMLVVTVEKIETNRAMAYSGSLLAPYAVDPGAIATRVERERAPCDVDDRQGARRRAARSGRRPAGRYRAAAAADARLHRRRARAQGSDLHRDSRRLRRQHGLRVDERRREADAAGQRAGRAALPRRRPRAPGRGRGRRHRARNVNGRRVQRRAGERQGDWLAAAGDRRRT